MTKTDPRHNFDKVVTKIQSTLPNSLAIYAFGSRISGHSTADSDLDLAVLVAGYVDTLVLWELSSQLAEISGYVTDLLDFRAASTIMQYQIITTGICLWAKQPDAALYETFVLSEKTNLDEARAPLLKDIQTRGKIYAR
jgi:predicted nucleotidyltransferase